MLSWGSWAVPAGRSLALNLRIPSDPPKLPSDKSPALRDPGFGPNLICGRVHLLCFRKWDLPKQYVLQFTIYNLFSASPANVHPPCSRIRDMEIWEDLAPILARNGPLVHLSYQSKILGEKYEIYCMASCEIVSSNRQLG